MSGEMTSTIELDVLRSSQEHHQALPVVVAPDFELTAPEDETIYPAKSRVMLVAFALAISAFMAGMDSTIIATAIPYITDEFQALDQVGWYAGAYLVTNCLFQLLWGKAYKYFLLKPNFLLSILIFEVGSVLCASAPTSSIFILGRAIAGVGAAGMNAGYGVMITRLVPLRVRAVYDAWIGGVYSIASVTAPLIGGALTTSKATWRSCFWINVPCGVLCALAIGFFLKLGQGHTQHELPILTKLNEFDFPGALIFFGSVTSLLLALQWGGITYSWNSATIIALLVVSVALLVVWVPIQKRAGDSALLPFRVLFERNVWWTTIFHIFMGGGITVCQFFLPLWFQAIRGASPLSSGIMLLPLIFGTLGASLTVGALISWLGYPQPFLFIGGALFSLGCGLLTTFDSGTKRAHWIIYQAIVGIGPGLGTQAALMPAQIVLSDKDISVGLAIENFGYSLGGALFVPLAQTIFTNRLAKGLAPLLDEPSQSLSSLSTAGITSVFSKIPPKDKSQAVGAYNEAILLTFWLAAATGIASFMASFRVSRHISVKKKQS